MRKELLNKLSPQARAKVIELEAKYRECEEELSEIELEEAILGEKEKHSIKYRINNKNSALFFAVILIGVALSANVLAIGIAPGRVTLDFTPGMQKTIEFKIINNEHKDMKVVFSADGELAKYVTLNTESSIIDISASEAEKTFTYTVNLPDSMTPGEHEVKIAAAEVPTGKAGEGVSIGSTVVVTSQLLVKVAYPYKYAEIRLDVAEAQVNGTAKFYVEIDNLGVHDLVGMQAVVEILGPVNEKIAIIKSDTKTIAAGKKDALTAAWKADVNAGQYKAVVSLAYDEGKVATAEKVFNIGSLEVDVVDISVKNFKLGDIAKFDITVANKWFASVKDVYAQVQIFDEQSQQIANVKTASLDIPPMGRQILNAYWDTAGIREGTYSGKLLLNYANKVIERDLKTEIKLDSIKVEIVGLGITARATAAEGGRQNLMFILIVALIVINIAWFVYFKRQAKK